MTTEDTEVGLQDTHGLWRRFWMKTPTSFDDSTLVLWMQASEYHVDMRLPAEAEELQTQKSLSSLTPDQLLILATAEGFAGTTTVCDSVCTWTRRINLQGPLTGLDTGTLRQTPEGLLETGIHSSYEELWQHETEETPSQKTMMDEQGQTLFILWTNSRFALGRGWHERTQHESSLLEIVDFAIGRHDNAALARAFDQEFCMGRIEDGKALIEHSTLPMRHGEIAFDATTLSADTSCIELSKLDFHGKNSTTCFHSPQVLTSGADRPASVEMHPAPVPDETSE